MADETVVPPVVEEKKPAEGQIIESPELKAQREIKEAEDAKIVDQEKQKVEELQKKPEAQLTVEEKALIEKYKEEEVVEESPFKQVSKITGYEVEGEYELTHEGIAQYALKYKELGESEFEKKFQENYPEAYALAEHLDKGRSLEEFFKSERVDYSKLTLDEKNEDQLKSFIDTDLKNKGISESRRKVMIKAAIDTGTLVAEGKESFKSLQDGQKGQIDAEAAEYQRKEIKKNTDIQNFVKNSDQVIEKGEIAGFIIPQAERKAFSESWKQNLRYEDGKFFKVIEITPENRESEMQKEFLGFKKGNLADIVTRKATTQNVLKLQEKVGNSDKKKAVEATPKKSSKSLQEFLRS